MQHARPRVALALPDPGLDRNQHSVRNRRARNRRGRSRGACPLVLARTGHRHADCVRCALAFRGLALADRDRPTDRDRHSARPTSRTVLLACVDVRLRDVRIRVRILRMRSSCRTPSYRLASRRYIGNRSLARPRGNLHVSASEERVVDRSRSLEWRGRYELSWTAPESSGRLDSARSRTRGAVWPDRRGDA